MSYFFLCLPQCLHWQKQHQLLLLQVSDLNLHVIGRVQPNLSIRNDMIGIALSWITLLVPNSPIVIQTLPPITHYFLMGASYLAHWCWYHRLYHVYLIYVDYKVFLFPFFRLSSKRHLPDSHGYHLYSGLKL